MNKHNSLLVGGREGKSGQDSRDVLEAAAKSMLIVIAPNAERHMPSHWSLLALQVQQKQAQVYL